MKVAELLLVAAATASSPALAEDAPPLTADSINAADLADVPESYVAPEPAPEASAPADADAAPAEAEADTAPLLPDAAIIKLQVLLDRAGASPGVIDGFDGDNVRKAIVAAEIMTGLPVDGVLDDDLLSRFGDAQQVIGSYTIADADAAEVTGPVPEDYAEKAQMPLLGYADVAEAVAEKFHMDIDLLHALNPDAGFAVGETVLVADVGAERAGTVALIQADKSLRQVRAYAADGTLIVAYPATIGSDDNPSPSGTHTVTAIAPNPTYLYNPDVNFQQGDNTEVLTIPAGPNGPVGSMWIDLSEPTFGIHGTPEPSLIDKTGSHGCVRLTNWDAWELSRMVAEGVTVEFLEQP